MIQNEKEAYVAQLLQQYLDLPDTPKRFSRFDRRLAQNLYDRAVTLEQMQTAFLLASARRLTRKPDALPLGAIRSLHYFLPVLNEVLATPLPEDYLAYLRRVVSASAHPT